MLKPPHSRVVAEDEEQLVQAFVEARYEYHWAPLIGCLVAQLDHIGARQPSYVVGATTGISYQPPQDAELPALLSDGLSALGVTPRITDLTYPNRLQRFLARRRIRRELQADRPVTTYGVGVSAFGPAWGLIVGCDDDRSAWRRDGPMTEQVSPWLGESEFNDSSVLILIAATQVREPGPEDIKQASVRALDQAVTRARQDLLDRIALLDSDIEVEPQQYSHEAQALAANWGEAANFWREFPHAEYKPIAQQLAVTLSRYATLFPYPMGGQPNNPGVRSAAVHILHEAASVFGTGH